MIPRYNIYCDCRNTEEDLRTGGDWMKTHDVNKFFSKLELKVTEEWTKVRHSITDKETLKVAENGFASVMRYISDEHMVTILFLKGKIK